MFEIIAEVESALAFFNVSGYMRPILASTPNSTLTSSTIGTSLKIGRAENIGDETFCLFLLPEYGYLQGLICVLQKLLVFIDVADDFLISGPRIS
ncbi:hypothetical protein RLH37_00730, partial [Streptococcus pneumoniae]|nr:hypothetical protein [Streptococcus pneumoniae]